MGASLQMGIIIFKYIMWKKQMLWVGCLLLPFFFTNCDSCTTDNNKPGDTDSLHQEQVYQNKTHTYGTSEVSDTARIGNKIYRYEMVCYADTSQTPYRDEFGDTYLQNKVELTLWNGSEKLGTKTFVKSDFMKDVNNEVRQQIETALLTGFIYDSSESDAGRLCFRTTIGWGGEGPKFKVYIASDASAISITYDDSDANAYKALD